jgi:hypothetical protein
VEKRFHELSMQAFVQATENEEKVLQSFFNLTGDNKLIPERSESEGLHHNPILLLTLRVRKKKEIEMILNHWKDRSFWRQAIDQKEIRTDDDLVFHVRVDKDSAYLGNPILWAKGESIKIKLKIATYPASRPKAMDILSELV